MKEKTFKTSQESQTWVPKIKHLFPYFLVYLSSWLTVVNIHHATSLVA